MNSLKVSIAVVAAAFTAFSARAQTTGEEFEPPPRISPDRVLSPTAIASGNHRVRNQVKTRGNWLEFEIESDFGTFRVLTLPMVAVRVHEIRTLAQAVDEFRRDNRKLAETLRGQLTVGADSFVDILTSPLDTTSQIVTQFGSNVAQTFDELRERAPEDDGQAASEESVFHGFEPGDPILASHKRNLASQLNLDLYSSNPKVQEFLDTVAAARGAGQQSAGVVTISLPRNDEVRVADGRAEAEIRAAMTHNTINLLYARNLERLVSSGIDRDLGHAFLSAPHLSPRHKTAITEYAALLDGVDNRGALLKAALSAQSEEEALTYLQVAKMTASYHERKEPLRGLVAAGRMVLATTKNGALLVLLPFDLLYWNRETARVFSGLSSFAREKGFKTQSVISSSIITDAAQRQLTELGFDFEQRFLKSR